MNNNETNYEFVDRDYDSVVNGNEKKIQFYSRTFDAIHDKYKKWRQNKLKRSIVNTENQIYSNTNILNKVYLSEHSQDKIKRKLEHLQDKVEYLNLALEDENYLHVSVRLLKVAERARNSISRWWKDFIKNVPVVGKMYEQKIAANDEPSNVQDNINVDDIISPQTVEEMINKQFATDDNKEQENNSSINQEDTTYRFGRDELANMPGRVDVINPTNDNQNSTNNSQAENNSNINPEDTTYRLESDELANMSGRIDIINLANDNQNSTDDSQVENNEIENGISVTNGSLIIPNEFTIPFEQNDNKPNENVQNNSETNTNSNSSINNNSDTATATNDQDTIAALEQYKEILKKQIEKKKQMALEKEKAQHEYEQAQEKNNKVRDENNYLKEMISTRLNLMEESLNEESQKTQAELNLMCDKTNKLNSSTNQLDQANESLKAMCNELNIGVQENVNNNSKGRSK